MNAMFFFSPGVFVLKKKIIESKVFKQSWICPVEMGVLKRKK
jgi:hypothetical protein